MAALVLKARVARQIDNLDLKLFEEALALRRSFEVERAQMDSS